MKVVGEEGTSIDDFVLYLKAEFVDAAYLQQDAYHEIDGATSIERQVRVFGKIAAILAANLAFPHKDAARTFFQRLTQVANDWNRTELGTAAFTELEQALDHMVLEVISA
jgi:V/A-type H+-transporting ATPase subunit A